MCAVETSLNTAKGQRSCGELLLGINYTTLKHDKRVNLMATTNWIISCIFFFALACKNLSVKSVVYFQPLYVILYYTFCEDITLLDFYLVTFILSLSSFLN